ncbi:hypothetical protein [Rhodococcus rhodochrous]|uniref:hypothetical protein n=1 Tax=Rhodococcus rhodochrous TaxID=1829 RepID=UPI0023F9FBAB
MQLSSRHAEQRRRELHADGQRVRRRHTARGSSRIPKNTDDMLRRTLRYPDAPTARRSPLSTAATCCLVGHRRPVRFSVVGFCALVFSSKPTLADLFGFFWPVVFLAALVTGLAQVVNLRRNGRGPLQPAP